MCVLLVSPQLNQPMQEDGQIIFLVDRNWFLQWRDCVRSDDPGKCIRHACLHVLSMRVSVCTCIHVCVYMCVSV